MTAVADIVAARAGDQQAFERILADHRTMIRHYSTAYYAGGIDTADLEQEARVGLWKAIRDFDLHGDVPFSSFAKLCVGRNVVTAVKTATRVKHRLISDAIRESENDEGEIVAIVDLLPGRDTSAIDRMDFNELVASLGHRIRTELTETEAFALLGIANGLTYHTLDRVCHGGEKVVDNALQRARTKLERDPKPTGKVYCCPSCGGATVRRRDLAHVQGRPPRCVVCRFYALAPKFAKAAA